MWLRLPVNVTALLNAPFEFVQTAAFLQNTCDLALIYYHSAQEMPAHAFQGGERKKRAAAEEGHSQSQAVNANGYGTANHFDEFRQFEMQSPQPEYSGNYLTFHSLKATKGAVARLCQSQGMKLPSVDTDAERYRLGSILHRQHLKEAFVDISYDVNDGVQRTAAGRLPSAFSAIANNETRCLASPGTERAYHKCDLYYEPQKAWDKLDDDESVVYTLSTDGLLNAYVQPRFTDHTHEDLMVNEHMDRIKVKELDYLVKLVPVCQHTLDSLKARSPAPTPESSRAPSVRPLAALRTATQLCYDTVERLELMGVTQELKANRLWQAYSLHVGEQNTHTRSRRSRHKRWILGIAGRLLRMMTSSSMRTLGSSVIGLAPTGIFKRVLPKSRKGFGILSRIQTRAAPSAPLMMGIAGLGYNVWKNYRTNQRLDDQAKLIETNRADLRKQAQGLRVIQLTVSHNTEEIHRLADEVDQIKSSLAHARDDLDLVSTAAELQGVVMRASQEASDLALTYEGQLREVSEILSQAQAGRVPNALAGAVQLELKNHELSGDQVMQHPDEPVQVMQIVRGGQIDIFAQFLAGESEWELYQIIPLPRFADGRAYTRRAAFEYALVGGTQKTYIPLDVNDANKCQRGACQATGVVRRVLDDPCTIAMIALASPSADCPMDESPGVPYLKATSGGLLYSVPEPLVARLHCREGDSPHSRVGVDQPLELSGIGLVHMPKGCNIELNEPEVTVLGPPSVVGSEQRIASAVSSSLRSTGATSPNLEIQRASTRLASRYREHIADTYARHRQLIGKVIMYGSIVVGILAICICIGCGKSVWLVRRIHHLQARVKSAKATFDTTLTSLIGFARESYAILSSRETLRQYINGVMLQLPVRARIDTGDRPIDLSPPLPEEAAAASNSSPKASGEGESLPLTPMTASLLARANR